MESPYNRKFKLTLDEVFSVIGPKVKYHSFNGCKIKTTSLRYKLFKQKGTRCVSCGLVGSFFALERDKLASEDVGWHLNLYAVDKDGSEVLMTKDHIFPKSRGGKDTLENLQTMCTVCNFKKGNTI
jgi:5-methylcytosine-specific restriction endonuclease McrA